MPGMVVKRNDGLKEIEFKCFNENCNARVKAIVATDFKGKMRKFCHACKQNT
jgi:hypothetical protein